MILNIALTIKGIFIKGSTVFILLLILGCTSDQISKDYVLKSGEGAFVVGIKSTGAPYVVSYERYDSSKNIRSSEFAVTGSFGKSSIEKPNVLGYSVGAELSGSYYFSQVSILGYGSRRKYVQRGYVFSFEIVPGQITYIGNFEVDYDGRLRHLGYDRSVVTEYLSGYRGLKGNVVQVAPELKLIKVAEIDSSMLVQ